MKLLLPLLMVMLSGCAVKSRQWNIAAKFCEKNGGVEWVEEPRIFADQDFKCVNGAIFTFTDLPPEAK